MADNWDCDKEDKLIELWKEMPCLYNISCKEYSNRITKRKALEEIGNKLDMSGKLLNLHAGHAPRSVLVDYYDTIYRKQQCHLAD